MPRAGVKRKMKRCAFWEHGRQCSAAGRGNPPLCARHEYGDDDEPDLGDEDEVDPLVSAVVDRVMQHPTAKRMFWQVGSVLDQFTNIIDRASGAVPNPPPPRPVPPPRPRAAPPPPPPPPRPTMPRDDHRAVLGIPPNAVLSRKLIKERQRELAKRYHPDKAAKNPAESRMNTEVMKSINAAAAELLKEVRA